MNGFSNGRPFSTADRDNDEAGLNCAEYYTGAWWLVQNSKVKQMFVSTFNTFSKQLLWQLVYPTAKEDSMIVWPSTLFFSSVLLCGLKWPTRVL